MGSLSVGGGELMATYTLDCIDCGSDLAPRKPTPRVPLCGRCKDTRHEAKLVARERRREARDRVNWAAV